MACALHHGPRSSWTRTQLLLPSGDVLSRSIHALRIGVVPSDGFEPPSPACRTGALPLSQPGLDRSRTRRCEPLRNRTARPVGVSSSRSISRLRIDPSWCPLESNQGLSVFNRALVPCQLGHREATGRSPTTASGRLSTVDRLRGVRGTRTPSLRCARPLPCRLGHDPVGADRRSAGAGPRGRPDCSGGRTRTPTGLRNREVPSHLGDTGKSSRRSTVLGRRLSFRR